MQHIECHGCTEIVPENEIDDEGMCEYCVGETYRADVRKTYYGGLL